MPVFRFIKILSVFTILGTIGQANAVTTGTSSTTEAIPILSTSDPLSALKQNVATGKIIGGIGIAYVGKFVYDNAMAQVDWVKKFPIELSIINAKNGFAGYAGDTTPAEAITIPPTISTAWNDLASNPDEKTTNLEKGFGSGRNAQWYLLDLSKLAAGNYYVSVKVERYDDGQKEVSPAVSNDDLVPAVTVFDGYQNRGISGTWFPNKFQATKTPFWAEMLKPENVLEGLGGDKGFDTAFNRAGGNDSLAQVQGTITLDSTSKGFVKSNRYLTIALGGDDRNYAAPHDVNYKLTIKLHKK